MPYVIRHDGKPPKEWCVYNESTDEQKGCSESKEAAKKFKKVLDMREHGVPPKDKEAEDVQLELPSPPVEQPLLSAEYVQLLENLNQELLRQKVAQTMPLQPVLPDLPEVSPEEVEEKAEANQDKLRDAQKARARQYNISPKEGGHLTPPKGYPTEAAEYGDPVNYRYPADSAHAKPALTRFNDSTHRTAGGYSTAEWAIMGGRLAKLISRHLPASYEYSSGKLQQREKKEEVREEPVEPTLPMALTEQSALDQIRSWVKDIWGKLCCGPKPFPFLITKQQEDGRYRWVSISSTAFMDRETEIVSTDGIRKSIARADENSQYGDLTFWHEPIVLGSCDFQAQHGVCLLESGLWGDTPIGKAARESSGRSPSRWGKSIEFAPLACQEGVIIKGAKVARVWTDLQIVGRSILPSSHSASLFTQISTRGKTMEEQKKAALKELLGDDALFEEVLARAEEINSKATPDAIFKEAETDAEPPPAEGETPVEDTEVQPEESSEASELLVAVKAMREGMDKLAMEVKALQETQNTPRAILHRPSQDTPDTPVTEEKGVGVPRVVQQMTGRMLKKT